MLEELRYLKFSVKMYCGCVWTGADAGDGRQKMSECISVIIPVYNVEKFLDRCMESVVNQTYKNIEIILVDDGSTDSSGTKCDEWEKKDSRVIVIHKENSGLSGARNSGLERASGKYVLFIDSDDCVNKDICHKLHGMLTENEADIAIGSPCKFSEKVPEDGSSEDCRVVDGKFALEQISREYKWVVAWGKLYKREIIGDMRFPEGKLHEDEFVIHELYYKCNKVAYTDDVLYYYFYNEDSITGKKFSARRMDVFEALRNRLAFYEQRNEEKLFRITIIEMIEMMVSYAKLMDKRDDKDVLEKMKKDCKSLFLKYKRAYGITLWKYPKVYAFVYPALTWLTWIVRGIKKYSGLH